MKEIRLVMNKLKSNFLIIWIRLFMVLINVIKTPDSIG
tara:strand:+ start:502 stop:615 length:114 start_codon:yes stop_codon:yes gene_type:complete